MLPYGVYLPFLGIISAVTLLVPSLSTAQLSISDLARVFWPDPVSLDLVESPSSPTHRMMGPPLLSLDSKQPAELHAPNFSTPTEPMEGDLLSKADLKDFHKNFLNYLQSPNLSSMNSGKYFWLNSPQNKATLDSADSIKNDVTEPLGYYKMVTLCDKTLAIADYLYEGETLFKCELFDLEKNPEKAFHEAHRTGVVIQKVGFAVMRRLIDNCREIAEVGAEISTPLLSNEDVLSVNLTTTENNKNNLWSSWRALVPGTKWCGLGDSAKSYYDLGKRKEIDICCRAHDHCPIRLKALRVGYGLINLSLYTKSHCECDEDFSHCLKRANSKLSERLGNFFFNIMKFQCIRREKALVCIEFRKTSEGKEECIRYQEDRSNKMVFTQPELYF